MAHGFHRKSIRIKKYVPHGRIYSGRADGKWGENIEHRKSEYEAGRASQHCGRFFRTAGWFRKRRRQAEIDWKQVKNAGITFAMVRCGNTLYGIDSYFG